MFSRINIALAIVAGLTVGCTSTDVHQYEGGKYSNLGYQEEAVADGLYRIQFGASRLLFSSKPSWDGWHRRATFLCENDRYSVLNQSERLAGHIMQPGGETFLVKAYAVCQQSGLSDAEAQKIIGNFEHPPVVIDEAIVMNCTQSSNFEIGPAFREAAKLRTVGRDKEAVACYESIAQHSTETVFKKQALYELGLLYEVGIGIEQDAAKSSYYYSQWEKL